MEPIYTLSPRQLETLQHISEGKIDREIAHLMNVAECTIRRYVDEIYCKLGLEGRGSRVKAAKFYWETYGKD